MSKWMWIIIERRCLLDLHLIASEDGPDIRIQVNGLLALLRPLARLGVCFILARENHGLGHVFYALLGLMVFFLCIQRSTRPGQVGITLFSSNFPDSYKRSIATLISSPEIIFSALSHWYNDDEDRSYL